MLFGWLAIQSLASRLVEQMHERRVRLEPDLVARTELMAFAEHRDDLLAAQFCEHLGFRPGRLDHDDLGFRPVVGDGEMLGPHAVDHGLAVGIGGWRYQRQLDAVRTLKRGRPVHPQLSFLEIYRWGTHEPRDGMVFRLVRKFKRRAHL